MLRDGRWFWWVVLACVAVLAGDVAGYGPFAEDDRQQEVEVLGDQVQRESSVPTTTTTTAPPPTSVSEDEQLESLEGLDQETLDALEELRGLDPDDLPPATSPPEDSNGGPGRRAAD